MKHNIVRINKIVLSNFKNVKKGIVEMPAYSGKELFSEKADVLGLYGQNGSGKTSVVEALRFVKMLLSGEELPADTKEYIAQGEEECEIDVSFSVAEEVQKETVNYSVALKKDADGFVISHERMTVVPRKENIRAVESTLIDYQYDNEDVTFAPEYRYKKLVANDKKVRVALNVAQAISIKSHQSFIFGEEGYRVFSQSKEDVMGEYSGLFAILQKYALVNLFVINNEHSGPISMNLVLPVAFYLRDGEHITTGDLPIRIDEPSVVTQRQFRLAQTIIDGMNIVLKNVIPGMEVEVHNFGEQLLDNGDTGYKIELLSKRGDISIPLKYESEGIVKIDGVDVKDYTFEALYNKLGYVTQKAVLFSDTIEGNVAFGEAAQAITEEDVKKAIDISQAQEFIDKMEEGLYSHIAQSGGNVSGGQKQRLSIARAIARNPEILIFDDSFSALDYKTDKELRRRLSTDLKGTTCVIVAQRIGTIRHADKIIVLDGGKMAGIGTHEELMKNCEVYQEIALSQLSKAELA